MNATLPAHLLMTERRPVPAEMIAALKARFGERCSTAQAVCELENALASRGSNASTATAPPGPAATAAAGAQGWGKEWGGVCRGGGGGRARRSSLFLVGPRRRAGPSSLVCRPVRPPRMATAGLGRNERGRGAMWPGAGASSAEWRAPGVASVAPLSSRSPLTATGWPPTAWPRPRPEWRTGP